MPKFAVFDDMTKCDSCPLKGSVKVSSFLTPECHEPNTSTVVDVLVIGQSPGSQEVKLRRPFVGPSGELINKVMTQYTKRIVYCNVINCRPVDSTRTVDRPPVATEVKACRGRFELDVKFIIETCKPKVVLVFGQVAKKAYSRIADDIGDKSLLVYFINHPAFILRSPHMKPSYVGKLHDYMKSVFSKSDVEQVVAKKFVIYEDFMADQFIADFKCSQRVGVDIETSHLGIFRSDFVIGTVSFSCDDRTYFFDFRNSGVFDARSLGGASDKFRIIAQALADGSVQKVFADVLFDVVAFGRFGVPVNNYTDLMPLAFIYDNTHNEYGLEAITLRTFPEFSAYKSKFQSSLVDMNFLAEPTEKLASYNNMDSYLTRILYNHIYSKVNGSVRSVFDKITVPLLPVLVDMKICGMRVDTGLIKEYDVAFAHRFVSLQQYLKDRYNINNVNSHPQARKMLFDDLKLHPVRYSKKTKQPSTDKVVIRILAQKVPDVMKLYEARRISSLRTGMMKAIVENTGSDSIIHPGYKHYGIQTYRLSCREPNLQGISRDDTEFDILNKYPLRRVFSGRNLSSYMVEFDFSQQEVRIVACLSKDPNMLKAFNEGLDIHSFVASIIFGKSIDEVTKFERQVAKGCVFGAIFGVSAPELAISVRISEREAQGYINQFFTEFGRVKMYIDRFGQEAVRNKVVRTILGRPRKFVVHQHNRQDTEREGANFTIQAVGADITFLSLIRVRKKLIEDGKLVSLSPSSSRINIMHTVHDSILFEAAGLIEVKYLVDVVPGIMSGVPRALGLEVPFTTDYRVGHRWGESIKFEEPGFYDVVRGWEEVL